MQGPEIFVQALSELGWVSPEQGHQLKLSFAAGNDSNTCLLKRLRDWEDHQSGSLTRLGQSALRSLLGAGACLLNRWPAHCTTPVDSDSTAAGFADCGHPERKDTENSVVERWVGHRFYFSHVRRLQPSIKYCSIACSRVGRGGSQLPQWPSLLDWALRMIRRDQLTLLAIPETTLYDPTVAYAAIAQLPLIQLRLPPAKFDRQPGDHASSATIRWLVDRLSSSAAGAPASDWHNRLEVSPQCSPVISIESDINSYPLQDRFALALADRVFVLSVRRNGKLFGLIQRRLSDPSFSPGSLFVACPDGSTAADSGHRTVDDSRADRRNENQQNNRHHIRWLMDQGAVGWLVLSPPQPIEIPWQSSCTKRPGGLATHQICVPADRLWESDQESWEYLAHCTRGWRGALPQESEISYLLRLWHQGNTPSGHPLLTLIKILDDGYLRGTTWLTRGRDASVSLTAVPLKELLSRRSFRSHLGRWDWEPYGLLFRRQHLTQARPVTYAPASEYQQLNPTDQAYFQPSDSKYDWSAEKEWRVLGDINLRCLPPSAVTAFVRSRREAIQLARVSPFSVIWTEST